MEHTELCEEAHRSQSGDQTGVHHRAAEEGGLPTGGEERRGAEDTATDRPGGEERERREGRGRSQESTETTTEEETENRLEE